MTGKSIGFVVGGMTVGYIINRALWAKIDFFSKYPEILDGLEIVVGWGVGKVTKREEVKTVGYGFIAAGVGSLILDLYKRTPVATALAGGGAVLI